MNMAPGVCVCLCRLLFSGTKSVISRVNVDGTDVREVVSNLSALVQALSVDQNNTLCWGQVGNGQRTVFNLTVHNM